MRLTPGDRFGPYEVLGPLGAGGMGEVHRARDTRLHRDVALKILPDDVARDPERVSRLTREARLLASLNHPHVAAIYGVEEQPEGIALVLELIEGPTLADRLASGPLPVDDVVTVARELAEAIEAAHARGVLHRDLKPANLKFTADGTLKVLDFGIAKAMDEDASRADAMAPTIAPTRAGVVIGTPSYMSPEQATGSPVDKRTDIWAFGCVLYEMLTGRLAFQGTTSAETLGRIRGNADPESRLTSAVARAATRSSGSARRSSRRSRRRTNGGSCTGI